MSRMTRRRMRVCHVVATFAPIMGGIQTATLQLCRSLRQSGVDAVVLTRRFPGTRRFETIEGVPVIRAGMPGRGKLAAATFLADGYLLLAVRLRCYRILHVQNLHSPLTLGFLAERILRRCLIVTVHAETMITLRERQAMGRLRLRALRRNADEVVAVSEPVLGRLLEAGFPEERLHVIPNGVDLRRFRPLTAERKAEARRRLNLSSESTVFVFVGRLVDVKRVDWLLRALADERSAAVGNMIVVGDGPECEALQQLAMELGLTGVRFVGEQQDVLPFLQAADVFVLPSRHEGLPVALLEATAIGLPSIVSDLPGIREVLAEDAALFVPVDDPAALRDALKALASSVELRTRLGARAQEAVTRRFSILNTARSHLRLYEDSESDPARRVAVPSQHAK